MSEQFLTNTCLYGNNVYDLRAAMTYGRVDADSLLITY